MSAITFMVALVLAGQVTAAGDRYSNDGTATGGGALEALENPLAEEANSDGHNRSSAAPLSQPTSSGSAAAPSSRVAPPPFSNMQSQGTSGSAAPRGFAPSDAASQIQPTTIQPLNSYPSQGAAAAAAPKGTSTGLKPSAMMRAMLTPPSGSRLAGQPIGLARVVTSAPSRVEQSERIEAYWDLCSSIADYYLGLGEQEELRRLRGLLGGASPSATWQQAEAELRVRVNTSQVAALASQYRLANLLYVGGAPSVLPLPADVPHCGKYETHYEQIFSSRQSAEAQELAALMPLRYDELKGAANAVTRAEEWLAAQRAADETALLRALELLALRRRAFVQIARDYNRRIVRYSELAAPGEIDSGRLIGMLIESRAPATATRSSSAAPPPSRQSSNAPGGRRTYAEGWTPVDRPRADAITRDEAVEPASAESQTLKRERSLLVSPR